MTNNPESCEDIFTFWVTKFRLKAYVDISMRAKAVYAFIASETKKGVYELPSNTVLSQAFKVSESALKSYLKILRTAGLIEIQKVGKFSRMLKFPKEVK